MNRDNNRAGVRFTEEMKGYVSFGEEDPARGAREGRESATGLMFHLTIEVEDLDRFAADERRGASARGWVRCEALGGRLLVERGEFNLLVDHEEGSSHKRMLYRLFLRDGAGHRLTLTGFKLVGSAPGLRVWRDTTTLYTRILRGHVRANDDDDVGAETVASGVLRLRPPAFLKQLTTFRSRAATPAARVAAIGRFNALFLEGLWRAYGGRYAEEVRNLAMSIRRRAGRWKKR